MAVDPGIRDAQKKEAGRRWRDKNRELLRLASKKRYAEKRVAINAKAKVKRDENPELSRLHNRESYKRHAEKRRSEAREKRTDPVIAAAHADGERLRRASDPEGYSKRRRDLRGANPFPHRERQRRRRALKRATAASGLTGAQWLEVLEMHDNRCAYCLIQSSDLEVDHVIALARGGSHSTDNVVPACRVCNSSKNNKSLLEIFEPRLLIEQRRSVPLSQLK